MQKTVAIVAGEASGDLIGSGLIRNIKKKYPNVRFIGVGGPLMISEGVESLLDYERLSLHGLGWDVIKKLPSLIIARMKIAERIISESPALFIGIDAPDFNLGLEAQLKKHGITTIHYVSPSIWAWRKGRLSKIKKSVTRMLTLFPFEIDCYRNTGITVDYVGHPLADSYPLKINMRSARDVLHIDQKAIVFSFLPGSRLNEVKLLSETLIRTAIEISNTLPEAVFLIPMVNRATKEIFERNFYHITSHMFSPPKIRVLFGHSKLAMEASDLVLAASGTATLEAALLKKPMVITYKVPFLSWILLKRLKYLPFIGLPNILSGKLVVPEIIQSDATPKKLSDALVNLLNDKQRKKEISSCFLELHRTLRQNTERKITEIISEYLNER